MHIEYYDIICHFPQPYLHESRHLHAVRRARGCGGRFLNKKKPDSPGSNAAAQKGMTSSNADSSNSESCEIVEHHKQQEMHPNKAYSNSNGNSFYLHHQGYQLPPYHFSSDHNDRLMEDGDLSGKQRQRLIVNGAHRALTIKLKGS